MNLEMVYGVAASLSRHPPVSRQVIYPYLHDLRLTLRAGTAHQCHGPSL
jgi:hypothetical protein